MKRSAFVELAGSKFLIILHVSPLSGETFDYEIYSGGEDLTELIQDLYLRREHGKYTWLGDALLDKAEQACTEKEARE